MTEKTLCTLSGGEYGGVCVALVDPASAIVQIQDPQGQVWVYDRFRNAATVTADFIGMLADMAEKPQTANLYVFDALTDPAS